MQHRNIWTIKIKILDISSANLGLFVDILKFSLKNLLIVMPKTYLVQSYEEVENNNKHTIKIQWNKILNVFKKMTIFPSTANYNRIDVDCSC